MKKKKFFKRLLVVVLFLLFSLSFSVHADSNYQDISTGVDYTSNLYLYIGYTFGSDYDYSSSNFANIRVGSHNYVLFYDFISDSEAETLNVYYEDSEGSIINLVLSYPNSTGYYLLDFSEDPDISSYGIIFTTTNFSSNVSIVQLVPISQSQGISSAFVSPIVGLGGAILNAIVGLFKTLIYANGTSGTVSSLAIFGFCIIGLSLATGLTYVIVNLVRKKR